MTVHFRMISSNGVRSSDCSADGSAVAPAPLRPDIKTFIPRLCASCAILFPVLYVNFRYWPIELNRNDVS